jgi:hypothetical protein
MMSTAHADEQFAEDVLAEVYRARQKYPPINSPHEGYAVILEEVEEFWDEVKRRDRLPDNFAAMGVELRQIAAMALRTYVDTVDGRYP